MKSRQQLENKPAQPITTSLDDKFQNNLPEQTLMSTHVHGNNTTKIVARSQKQRTAQPLVIHPGIIALNLIAHAIINDN